MTTSMLVRCGRGGDKVVDSHPCDHGGPSLQIVGLGCDLNLWAGYIIWAFWYLWSGVGSVGGEVSHDIVTRNWWILY